MSPDHDSVSKPDGETARIPGDRRRELPPIDLLQLSVRQKAANPREKEGRHAPAGERATAPEAQVGHGDDGPRRGAREGSHWTQVSLLAGRTAAELHFRVAEKEEALARLDEAHNEQTRLVLDLRGELELERVRRALDTSRALEAAELATEGLVSANEKLQNALALSEADRPGRLQMIQELQDMLSLSAERLSPIGEETRGLHAAVARSEHQRAESMARGLRRGEELSTNESDRAAWFGVIEELQTRLCAQVNQAREWDKNRAELLGKLAESEADRAARLTVIERLYAEGQAWSGRYGALQTEAERLGVQVHSFETEISAATARNDELTNRVAGLSLRVHASEGREGEMRAALSTAVTSAAAVSQLLAQLSSQLTAAHNEKTASDAASRKVSEVLRQTVECQGADMERLRGQLEICENDRAARMRVIEKLMAAVAKLESSMSVKWARRIGRMLAGGR